MMDYVDVTPLVSPIVNWAQIASFEPQRNAPQANIMQTRSARSKDNTYDLFMSGSGALAPTSVVDSSADKVTQRRDMASSTSSASRLYALQGSDVSEIDRIAKQRVKLMAAKYASGTASAELLARLEILNRRLLDRSPRVSSEQVEALELANENLMRIRAAREERARRLGIRA